MTRSAPTQSARRPCRRPNCCAVLISLAAVSVLYINFEPKPAEADPDQPSLAMGDFTGPSIAPIPTTPSAGATDRQAAQGGKGSQQSPGAQAALQGERALLMNLLLLERGHRKLSRIPDYTATFVKRERINGVLGESQTMQLKVRHKPFSVYMKWLKGGDEDRELLYVEGQNGGKMLVRIGGVKGKFLPALKLDPNGSLAMKESRYPVTKIGLLELAQELIAYRQNDLNGKGKNCCQMLADQKINNRDCYCFLVQYKSKKTSELYRKSIICIDKETSLPVFITSYTWPGEDDEKLTGDELDKATFIESYTYSNIRLNAQLAEHEFQRTCKNYGFSRQ